ncbi:hypothetical protein CRT60_00975 [Azospirillum palustre]|uniref:Uncharacterized protein n=1 Tax=Azospirillum palustre TaxID=2044885 RepID=A0A2B8BPS4_9PROT|nr:hypothetical protein [Azospirillum palustre]PGH59237.1 hypothetical protein CRT60_00975 [Azospirillum palustre]
MKSKTVGAVDNHQDRLSRDLAVAIRRGMAYEGIRLTIDQVHTALRDEVDLIRAIEQHSLAHPAAMLSIRLAIQKAIDAGVIEARVGMPSFWTRIGWAVMDVFRSPEPSGTFAVANTVIVPNRAWWN